MADQPSSIANLLRDPAERHPQRLYENGVLMHNWAEDRYTGHQKASADRTLLPWVQPPAFEATTLSETERVRREAKSYQPPQWREHTEPYSNDALMHNWYEDRLSRPLAGDSTMRCTAPTLRNHAEQMDAFQTTKTVFDNSMATAPTVNKPAKPTFVTLRNVSSTTHANRTTMRAPEKGFGAVLPSHPPGEGMILILSCMLYLCNTFMYILGKVTAVMQLILACVHMLLQGLYAAWLC